VSRAFRHTRRRLKIARTGQKKEESRRRIRGRPAEPLSLSVPPSLVPVVGVVRIPSQLILFMSGWLPVVARVTPGVGCMRSWAPWSRSAPGARPSAVFGFLVARWGFRRLSRRRDCLAAVAHAHGSGRRGSMDGSGLPATPPAWSAKEGREGPERTGGASWIWVLGGAGSGSRGCAEADRVSGAVDRHSATATGSQWRAEFPPESLSRGRLRCRE
jgi:hypothetical protein